MHQITHNNTLIGGHHCHHTDTFVCKMLVTLWGMQCR